MVWTRAVAVKQQVNSMIPDLVTWAVQSNVLKWGYVTYQIWTTPSFPFLPKVNYASRALQSWLATSKITSKQTKCCSTIGCIAVTLPKSILTVQFKLLTESVASSRRRRANSSRPSALKIFMFSLNGFSNVGSMATNKMNTLLHL